ncbi:AP-3 complex subunit sigma-2 [Patagioenas fasciata monilis]|uniref:AP-3 complex subunit sigma-2 n=1 Tax=Patagioenas fasciata monilis TaxID=372326 RepID=A0A1V4JEQ8_PATFA|nr:AP-3 complex subunit sigma-2 [Patagioenas fasciata monilis]
MVLLTHQWGPIQPAPSPPAIPPPGVPFADPPPCHPPEPPRRPARGCRSLPQQAEEVQQQIIRETFHLVLKRDDHICNFLECGSLFGGSDYKLIYRHYATLYFVFCVDSSESELGILDLIQVFVETLDKCFENVCELDLIFHMDKVHHILQEVVIGGMVLETNMNEIVAQVEAQSKLEKAEGGLSAAPSRAVSAVKNINLPEIPRNINIGDINIKVPNLSQFMPLSLRHTPLPSLWGEEPRPASPSTSWNVEMHL